MTAGQQFVKMIKPAGSALFILMFVMVLVLLFTSGQDPLDGYTPEHDTGYYLQDDSTLAELKTELEGQVFPRLEGVLSCEVRQGALVIVIRENSFAVTRSALLQYYDASLFVFEMG